MVYNDILLFQLMIMIYFVTYKKNYSCRTILTTIKSILIIYEKEVTMKTNKSIYILRFKDFKNSLKPIMIIKFTLLLFLFLFILTGCNLTSSKNNQIIGDTNDNLQSETQTEEGETQTEEGETMEETSIDIPQAINEKISAKEAKEMMDQDLDVIILDVRTEEEFDDGYIPGAILIPDYELQNKAEAILEDKNATILIYCRTGRRSAAAANKLQDMGYTKLYDFGGIVSWPYTIVQPN